MQTVLTIFGAMCFAAIMALVLVTGLTDQKLTCRFGKPVPIQSVVE